MRVWKVDTKGNHAQSATGRNMSIPINASNSLARERIDFHIPIRFMTGFQAHAIYNKRGHVCEIRTRQRWERNEGIWGEQEEKLTERIPHPVGIKANTQANMSTTDNFVSTTATIIPARAINKERPCINLSKSWKLTEIFWLKVKTYYNVQRKQGRYLRSCNAIQSED